MANLTPPRRFFLPETLLNGCTHNDTQEHAACSTLAVSAAFVFDSHASKTASGLIIVPYSPSPFPPPLFAPHWAAAEFYKNHAGLTFPSRRDDVLPVRPEDVRRGDVFFLFSLTVSETGTVCVTGLCACACLKSKMTYICIWPLTVRRPVSATTQAPRLHRLTG